MQNTVDDYGAFQLYMTLGLYFEGKFDYFKYNGKMGRITRGKFNNRKDCLLFHKLSQKQDVEGFLISNFSKYGKVYIRDLLSDNKYTEQYRKWKGYNASLSYQLDQEIELLGDNFSEAVQVKGDDFPPLCRRIMNGKISYTAAILIDSISDIFNYWNKTMEDNIIWNTTYNQLERYKPFVEIEKNKPLIKKKLLDKFT